MWWKFWKRKRKLEAGGETATGTRNAEARLARRSEVHLRRELLALQRVVGNQAVLRLLGLAEGASGLPMSLLHLKQGREAGLDRRDV